MGFDSPSHWAIVAVVVLVLFGYKKLPEMSRSVGRSLRIFKTEMKGMTDDDSVRDAAEQPAPTAVVPPTVPPLPTVPVVPAVPVVPPEVPGSAQLAVPPAPAAETPREAPQQQAQG
ncbi:MAG: Sec-independent protein translocase subunit TatA [Jatrophihabitantaceae bacterium]